jgi:hypothetical protein
MAAGDRRDIDLKPLAQVPLIMFAASFSPRGVKKKLQKARK